MGVMGVRVNLMADFVGVLRNAIDGLNDNRPATRGRIYEAARLALVDGLASVGPPSEQVNERWKRALEEAIAEVENSFVESSAELVAEPSNILGLPGRAGTRAQAAPDGRGGEHVNRSLRIMALALQKIVTWSLNSLAETFRWAKIQWRSSGPDAAKFSRVSLRFKLWHLLTLMGGVSVMAPLVVVPRAPIFLGPICAFNAVVSIVLVVKAKRLEE